jgi:hypothetical protein
MKNYGKRIFIADLKAFQLIDDDGRVIAHTESGTPLIKPISRLKVRLNKLMESWILIVGIAFSFLTFKIVIEQLMRLR